MRTFVTARHRARGVGRLIALRTAPPRHGVGATARTRLWWWLVGLAVLVAAVVTPIPSQEAETPRFAVPLPRVSVPAPETAPPASRRPLHAVRQALKARPVRVLLGPASGAELPALVGSYCRAAHGPGTLAVSAGADWFCAPAGRGSVALDPDAMCRWRYGEAGWADLGSASDPRSWRCFRDGP